MGELSLNSVKNQNNHTHTKSQISDFPTTLPANGGNADTVDGLHASSFMLKTGDTMTGNLQLNNGSGIVFNPYTNSGTVGIGLTDWGKIFGEHDLNTESSKIVVEIGDNVNDAIVLRSNNSGGGDPNGDGLVKDMITVNHSSINFAVEPTVNGTAISVGSYDAGHSFSQNGYQKFTNGLIMQWGYVAGSITTDSYVSVTFPIAFPNKVVNITSTYIESGATGSVVSGCTLRSDYSLTSATFIQDTYVGSGVGLMWSAIGY